MSLDLLRSFGFAGPIRPFVQEPPGLLQKWATGLHLRFDDFALAWAKHRAAEESRTAHWLSLPNASPRMLEQKNALRRHLEKIAYGGNASGLIHDWDRRCDEMGYPEGSDPITIIVDVSPDAPDFLRREAPRSFQRFPIRYRTAAPAEPNIGAGEAVAPAGSNDGGTLGGFLEDGATGEFYGLTCEHVVGAPGTVVEEMINSRPRIGVVSHSERSTAGGPCSQHAKPNAGTIDAALVKLDKGVAVTNVPKVTVAALNTVDQDDPVKFQGSSSGVVNTIRVSATTIWKAIDFGTPVCFADLFMLDFRHATHLVTAVSKGGDSGAWIIEDPSAPPTVAAWYGMLMAGDRQQSFACHGEHVFAWAKGQHPLRLP
jgi:hypothetical protein